MTERLCLYCQKAVHGRADKKFCDDQCRSAHNAANRRPDNDSIRRINAILKRNRDILKELNPDGKAVCPKSELLRRGFQFEYHTSQYTTKAGDIYYYCYDMGYLEISGERVVLVHRK